jgi:transposase
MTIAITRLERSAADLRAAAGRTQDAPVARRMLAIALVLEGWSRDAAAEACAMERQTLRDWVHRYNELGLAGLSDRPRRNGPPPRLSAEQQATVKQWVEQGPDLERDGVVRWRCVDLQRRIKAEFTVHLHERSVGKLLRRLDFTRLQPRPYHPKKAAVAQETFKRDFTRLAADALPPAAAGKPLEIWFESLPSGLTRGTRPEWVSKVLSPTSGRRAVHAHRRFATIVTTPSICSARSARSVELALPSSCRR